MYIVYSLDDNRVMEISDSIEILEGDVKVNNTAFVKEGFTFAEVDSVSQEVLNEPYKYLYINGSFTNNANWRPYSSSEERIAQLEADLVQARNETAIANQRTTENTQNLNEFMDLFFSVNPDLV